MYAFILALHSTQAYQFIFCHALIVQYWKEREEKGGEGGRGGTGEGRRKN